VTSVTTVIIGAGHSGLAMSKHLTDRSIDHVLLERGEVANSWATERWDSLRLLTPNWQSRLPGHAYAGDDPHGYMTMPEVADFVRNYAYAIRAPVQSRTCVLRVLPVEGGYAVETDRRNFRCRMLVIASGACSRADVPKLATQLSPGIASLTPMQYRNPGQLPDGGVLIVGASASGVQLASELRAAGREVVLSVGEHVRLPRVYRGRDIKWWMDTIGLMDLAYDQVDDVTRARRLPSLQLIGTPERRSIDLNTLQEQGVEVVGRLVGLSQDKAQFSGGLQNQCAMSDLKMNRMLGVIDTWVAEHRQEDRFAPPCRYAPTRIERNIKLGLDLHDRGIGSVIWATGYRPDYSWLDAPVFDRKGRLLHDGGVVQAPGMYVMGLPFLRRRKSSFIDGAADDAAELAAHLSDRLQRTAAA
jgi:putative flavoprotein involved in K+ transport